MSTSEQTILNSDALKLSDFVRTISHEEMRSGHYIHLENCAYRPPNVMYFYESFFVKSCVSSTLTFNYANEMPRSQAQVNNDVTDSVG